MHNGARAIWPAVAACLIALAFFGFAMLFLIREQDHIDRVASSTHSALCTFKADLARRADDTEVFITELEHGVRPMIPGITVNDLKRSLTAQRSTLASLTELKCL